MSEHPRILDGIEARRRARRIRDRHWAIMDRMALHGVLFITPWNKSGRTELEDEVRFCLISGMEWLDWAARHGEWMVEGEWDDSREARPWSLTEAGRAALADRSTFDMEPVYGGLVEPGWQAIPLERWAA